MNRKEDKGNGVSSPHCGNLVFDHTSGNRFSEEFLSINFSSLPKASKKEGVNVRIRVPETRLIFSIKYISPTIS